VAMMTQRPVIGSLRSSGKDAKTSGIESRHQQFMIISLSEGIPEPFDARWITEYNADDIEARFPKFHSSAASVVAGGAPEVRALLRIHRAIRRAELARGSRFDLYEDQGGPVPGHQVELARAGAGPVVARHHRAPVRPQIAVREILAEPPVIFRM
jgi:hypothetical protein